MTARAGVAQRLVTVGVPALLVMASVAILGVLALGTLLDLFPDETQYALFAAGVLSWMAGIAWGVLVNNRPS